VLAPETPLGDWFSHLDALVQRSPTLTAVDELLPATMKRAAWLPDR
jgi:hypothetical protein